MCAGGHLQGAQRGPLRIFEFLELFASIARSRSRSPNDIVSANSCTTWPPPPPSPSQARGQYSIRSSSYSNPNFMHYRGPQCALRAVPWQSCGTILKQRGHGTKPRGNQTRNRVAQRRPSRAYRTLSGALARPLASASVSLASDSCGPYSVPRRRSTAVPLANAGFREARDTPDGITSDPLDP